MVFSKNVCPIKKKKIMEFWGVHNHQQYDKYLGLPPMTDREKKKPFFDIKYIR